MVPPLTIQQRTQLRRCGRYLARKLVRDEHGFRYEEPRCCRCIRPPEECRHCQHTTTPDEGCLGLRDALLGYDAVAEPDEDRAPCDEQDLAPTVLEDADPNHPAGRLPGPQRTPPPRSAAAASAPRPAGSGGANVALTNPQTLIVTAAPARRNLEPQWRCPIAGCELPEVVYPEELEFHAIGAHPDWHARRAVVRSFRREEVQVILQRLETWEPNRATTASDAGAETTDDRRGTEA